MFRYDFYFSAVGLCGPYDLDPSNDLSFENGTVYEDTTANLQPIDYMKSWR